MPIVYDKSRKNFHLQAGDTSYIMQIVKEKYLVHLYWGRRISSYHESRRIIWKIVVLHLIRIHQIEHFH